MTLADPCAPECFSKRHEIATSILTYGFCSSVMLVSNKVAITTVPMPATLLSFQLFITILVVKTFKMSGTFVVDDLNRERVLRWLPYALSFCLTVYCNTKVLQNSNIETVIVFRACSPLLVCFLEYIFLGRQFPSAKSAFSLVGVVVGAVGYVLSDSQFLLHGIWGYGWVFVYLLTVTFEMTFGKFLMTSVEFAAPVWSSVFYTNAIAFPLLGMVAIFSGELGRLGELRVGSLGPLALLLSTSGGVAISWAGWNCRNKTSATTYTLVGVICKLASVMLNIMIWDKHATMTGIKWLVVCLLSSTLYTQAPMRNCK